MNAAQLLTHFDRLAEAPNAVSRLRRFILDLAVRGKLVEQDAGDEPAAELLMRIRTERLLVLNKPVKSSVALVTEPESTDIQLPVGWAWSKLGSLCTKTGSGSTPSGGKDAYVSSGVPFLRSQNVYDDGLRLEGVAFISDATQQRMSSTTVKAGDLLLNITGGSIGRCAVVPESFVLGNINQHVAIIRLALLESGCFLHSVICSDYFQKHIFGNQTGAGREGLPKNRMDEILIPLPPLAEQHRIVAKVDELMALCDQLEAAQQERERRRDRLASASLQRLNQPATDATAEEQREHARFHLNHLPRLITRPEQIKAMRQAIFSLAIEGRLIPQCVSDLRASTTLAQLGVVTEVFVSSTATIPETWDSVSFDQVAAVTGGVTLGRKLIGKKTIDLPYLRVANVKRGELDLNVLKVVSIGETELDRYALKTNDLLLTEGGDWDKVGRAAIWRNQIPVCLHQNHIFRARLRSTELSARWFELYFNAPAGRAYFENSSKQTTNLASINMRQVRACPVPLPPLAEQHRIVAKVDELMALCDQLEAQLTITQTDSRRLLEAVLA